MQFIYIVRHGETDANAKGQINDKNNNTPLNENGKKQASKTGKYFKKYRCKSNDKSSCVIYSSPSTRAVETSDIIAKQLKIKNIIYDECINEADYGLLSGTSPGDKIFEEDAKMWKSFNKKYKDPIELVLCLDKQIEIAKKKFNIETITERKDRVISFFNSLSKSKKNIIIVTHSNIIQIMISVLFNLQSYGISGDISNGKNCTIMCVTRDSDNYNLITLPNTLHLA